MFCTMQQWKMRDAPFPSMKENVMDLQQQRAGGGGVFLFRIQLPELVQTLAKPNGCNSCLPVVSIHTEEYSPSSLSNPKYFASFI